MKNENRLTSVRRKGHTVLWYIVKEGDCLYFWWCSFDCWPFFKACPRRFRRWKFPRILCHRRNKQSYYQQLNDGWRERRRMLFSRNLASFAFRNCNYSSFLCQSICKRELSSRNECCKNNVCCCVTLSNQMQISLCWNFTTEAAAT